jgi:hypothetical protein
VAKRQIEEEVGFGVIQATFDTVQACHREFRNELGDAGQQEPTPDAPDAPDAHSKNTSVADEYLLRPQEMNPFKAGSPAPSHIGGSRKTFPFAVAESPKIGEAGGEASEPTRTSRGRVKWLVTLPALFASGATIPPTCTRSYPDMSSRRQRATSGDWASSVEM